MNQAIYVKNNIIDRLMFSVNSLENVEGQLKDFLGFDFIPRETVYTYINRREHLSDFFNALNSDENKLILINGFQGTGKTELIRATLLALEDNVLNFYYECSQSSNLDDIILSLYRYLDKYLVKDQEYLSLKSESRIKSIDKRLINYLKNLKRPLLVVIDGFENCVSDDFSISDKEFLRFLNYLLSLTSIKLIISGRKVLSSEFNIDENKIAQFKLSGLDEAEAIRILKDNHLEGYENVLYQAYQITRGYPESLYLFISAVNILKLSPFDIIKEYSIHQESFEGYIIKKIYAKIPVLVKKVLWPFAAMSHSVNSDTLNKLNLGRELDDSLEYLVLNKLLNVYGNSYSIKDHLKHFVYNNIPVNEKIKIHQFLSDLYAEQISNSLENRIISLSRKSLSNEQHYHNLSFNNYKGNTNLNEQFNKYSSDMPLVSSYASKYDLNKLSMGDEAQVTVDESTILNELIGTKKEKSETDTHLNQQTDNKAQIESVNLDPDLKIELTEEEKDLLNRDDGSDEEQTSQISDSSELTEQKELEYLPENIRDKYIKNAVISKKKGNLSLALDYYKKALNVAKEIQDIVNMAKVSRVIANILESIKKYDESLSYLNKALDLYTELNDVINIQLTLFKIADVYRDNLKYSDALQYYNKILKFGPDNIQAALKIDVLIGIGDVYDYRGDMDKALKYYQEALEIAKKANDLKNISVLCFKIALIYDDFDDIDNAIDHYKKSIQITNNPDLNPYLSSSYANIAALYEDINDTNNAIINYSKSLEIDKLTNNYIGQCNSLSRLGNIYSGLDVKDKALGYFREEVSIARLTDDLYVIAMSYMDIGDFYLSEMQYEQALRSFILAKKNVGKTISTDSKEKIDRRFKQIMSEVGEIKFNILIENIKRKYG
ncbi:MAG: hypothetical protein A2287_02495 [Candidatus Melainabacteria bacterium RIFOXYA12_FULL_32_12]|nr:MAG: hypothetical protein A2255_00330 [Candidatus Melainabacteria bacterium RIFOXYA2_FULL_32_9]OGI30964.1 MAG: hypothetical protein A2287_02495 [Candidatus Melainabacteria bacterium RIFOXYA12_FULL_32_12]